MATPFRERAEAELKRGVLQMAVLSLLETPTYGYDLLKVLAERGLPAEEGTLYPILRRLERDGLLESSWDTSGSRPRKYYQSSDEGRAVLRDLVTEWSRVTQALQGILREAEPRDDDDPPAEPAASGEGVPA